MPNIYMAGRLTHPPDVIFKNNNSSTDIIIRRNGPLYLQILLLYTTSSRTHSYPVIIEELSNNFQEATFVKYEVSQATKP